MKAMLATVIEGVTGIEHAILTHEASLDSVSVARRISWASRRQTTREEDEAYSLMGILGVHLPTIYGEGRFAFIRLQEEVLKQTSDQSLFVWGLALRDNVELIDDTPSDTNYLWEEGGKKGDERGEGGGGRERQKKIKKEKQCLIPPATMYYSILN